jgi:hypothetical protein
MLVRPLSIFVAISLTVAATAQTLVRSVNGPAANAQYGRAVLRIPDQNLDGFDDVLVGAPGFDQERGAVYCLSGRFLAHAAGAQTLWTVAPTANQGDQFGFALAAVDDVTLDGVADFLVGQPGYDLTAQQDVGAVRLVDGVTHAVVSRLSGPQQGARFGHAIVPCGDVDGDGLREVAVGAPGPLSSSSWTLALPGSALGLTLSANLIALWAEQHPGSHELGTALASGFDLDGDGGLEVAIGVPGAPNGSGQACGGVLVRRATPGSLIGFAGSSIVGERFGEALDAAHDFDRDGWLDLVVGAPRSPGPMSTEPGRAVLVSGARLWSGSPPYEIFAFAQGSGLVVFVTNHFGSAVRGGSDLNGDGVPEVLVGGPSFSTTLPIGPDKGAVTVYSGATGARITSVVGSSHDRLGDALAGAVGDLDGDGFEEFLVAGSRSNAGGADSGVVKAYRLFPVAPGTYCTGKSNGLGCTPSVGFNGSPSASSGAPFVVTASNFLNQKNGLLFYSHAPSSTPFQGGTKCAASPTVRTGVQGSGGSPSGNDCTGTYALDFNARIASGIDPSLAVGAHVFAQYWARDPFVGSHTSLSNALRFLINP